MLNHLLTLVLIFAPAPDTTTTELTVSPRPVDDVTRAMSLRPEVLPRLDGDGSAMFFRAALLVNDGLEIDGRTLAVIRAEALAAGGESATDEQLAAARQAMVLVGDFKDPLTVAARHRTIDWGIPLQTRGFETLLPELNKLREMTIVLADEARFAIEFGEKVEGVFDNATSSTKSRAVKLDDAGVDRLVAENVRLMVAIADAVEQQPVLVSALVGASIRDNALGVIEDAIQRPGSANYRDILREMGPPRYELARLIAGERDGIEATFPQMARLRAENKVPGEVHEAFRAQLQALADVYQWNKAIPAPRVNYNPGSIRGQILALDTAMLELIVAADGSPEAFAETATAFEANNGFGPLKPVTASFGKVMRSFARTERAYRVLVVIEALRSEAAGDGLPADLDGFDVSTIDPTTGESFGYERSDTGFTLQAGRPDVDATQPARYVVTLRTPNDG
ncbi:MAG: hypothetical protein AAGD32_15440 [Planctomycetota bacterium]